MMPLWSQIVARGLHNYYRGYPLCVSIEVTHACTAACKHCNLGGDVASEQRATPAEYAQRLQEVGSPPFVQISGGEPLTRPDVYEVIRAVRGNNPLPLIILVTNGSLLEVEKYQQLFQAGINRISISLDFHDDRHDEFRRCSGLFQHLSEVVPRIAHNDCGCDLALNTAITKANFPYVIELARKAHEWGVGISYSAYTTMKTGDDSLMLSAEDTLVLDKLIDQLITLQARGLNILNPPSVLKRMMLYFREGHIPHCGAGKRFLIIRPDGALIPCSSFQEARYPSVAAMQAFVNQNQCGQCYVAIRAYTDRKITEFLSDGWRMLKIASTASNSNLRSKL